MFFDPIYLFYPMPALAFAFWAIRRLRVSRGDAQSLVVQLTGAEAALRLVRAAGLSSVTVLNVDGGLTDTFDPESQAIRLSSRVYHGRSLDSVAIAIHEAGQAIAAARHPILGIARASLLPAALYGSSIFWLLLASSVLLTNVPFFLASVAVLTINVTLQLAGLWLERRTEREAAFYADSCLELEADEKAIMVRACRATALRSLELTLTGAFHETVAVAYHKLLR